jgi:hypothetical protein
VNKRPLVAPRGGLRNAVALIILTTVTAGIFGLAGPASAKTKGFFQIGFTGTIVNTNTQANQRFKNVYLNVQEVRINQSATPSGGGFQEIPVSSGVQQQTGGKPADLQIDLNNLQNAAVLFNSAAVKATTYHTVEVDLDSKNPGSIVPLCPSGGAGAVEGCAPYKIVLANTGSLTFTIPGSVTVQASGLTSYIVNLALTIISGPSQFNGNNTAGEYSVNVVASQSTQQQLGTVQGTITGGSGINTKVNLVRNLTVTAEIAGTDTFVTSALVDTAGNYTLQLPVPLQPVNSQNIGALYDIYVSGGGVTYAAQRLAPLFPGTVLTQNFTVTPDQPLGTLSGKIIDACTGDGLAGATVQLLLPPVSSPALNCASAAMAPQCVSIASASADNTGSFPLPGQLKIPGPFENIPVSAGNSYALEITSPGYDPLFTTGSATANPSPPPTLRRGGTCAGTSTNTGCSVALTSGQISGTVTLAAAPTGGQSVLVQVVAENSGTNNIVGALKNLLLFKSGVNPPSLPFTMTIPTSPAALDLYATAIDLYQGLSDPYTGHTIIVQSDVPAFNGTVPACSSAPLATNTFVEQMNCVGHGSISGNFTNPDANTMAMLSKPDPSSPANYVQLFPAPVGPTLQLGTNAASPTFAFCAPADTYGVQRIEAAPVTASPTATPTATPTPIAIMIPAPSATSSPCPSSCFNSGSNTTCPGICNGVVVPNSL